MSDIILRQVDDRARPILEQWFQDIKLRCRLGGMLPLREWFDYIQAEPDHLAWIAYEDEQPVGYVDLEPEDKTSASTILLVNPALRGHDYGKRILHALLARPEVATLKQVEAIIETDNQASLHCFRDVGFMDAPLEPQQDHIVRLVYKVSEVG